MQYSEQDIKRTLAVSLSAYLLYFALFSGALVGTGVEATVSEAVEASAEAAAVPQTLPAEEAEAKLALPLMHRRTFNRGTCTASPRNLPGSAGDTLY